MCPSSVDSDDDQQQVVAGLAGCEIHANQLIDGELTALVAAECQRAGSAIKEKCHNRTLRGHSIPKHGSKLDDTNEASGGIDDVCAPQGATKKNVSTTARGQKQ